MRSLASAVRILQPLPSIQRIPTRFGRAPAPLLEEERDALGPALIAQRAHPRCLNRTGARPALPSRDDPVNILQIHRAHRTEQRLE